MHTRADVRPEHYKYFIDDKEVGLSDIFDGFEKDDRIGVVSRSPGGTLGISALFMAAISNYYEHFFEEDIVGNETEKLRIYPEYFIFHVGKETGSSGQIDVWPPNREVVVEDDSEQILEALNDRGINILLLEESDEKTTNFLRESISSAKSRIRKVLESHMEEYSQVPQEKLDEPLDEEFLGITRSDDLSAFMILHEGLHEGKIQSMAILLNEQY